MTKIELQDIESRLNIKLPSVVAEFLMSERKEADPDETSIMNDSDMIIEATLEYRKGFEGLQPWPLNYICLGDEADACPYVLDCNSGVVLRLDKGNVQRKPLDHYESFSSFLKTHRDLMANLPSKKEQRINGILYYVPVTLFVLGFFVVLPLIFFGISTAFKAIFK